jgi:hypothetical protein
MDISNTYFSIDLYSRLYGDLRYLLGGQAGQDECLTNWRANLVGLVDYCLALGTSATDG